MYLTIAALTLATMFLATVYFAPRIADRRVVYQTTPDRPCGFGYRMSWLAIRSRDTARIVSTLGLLAPEATNWQTGVGVVYDHELGDTRVFVTPPVNGWSFVVGLALPQPIGPLFVDKSTPLLLELGAEFIEVQYFLSYPQLDFHAWARVLDGKLIRAFAVTDEGVVQEAGKPTKEERSLGLKLFELRGVKGRKGDAGGELILHPTEEHVMRLAARWSLDPTVLNSMSADPALGIVGIAPTRWLPQRARRAA